ncbi:MAG: N-acetyltransferase [Deltaproteobacteria bacterium]|nr:N-acetyltransferase [Deltaproteobacteria bacterium]
MSSRCNHHECQIDPSARVAGAQIGRGTRIWSDVHILPGARIGERCNIGEGCFIESDVSLGNGVVLKTGISVWERVTLEDYVFVGPEVAFTNDRYPRANPDFRTGAKGWERTVVRQNATICANATLVCGIEIGEWTVVAAGAVVTKSIPAYQLWLGNPARFYRHVCMCGRPLSETLTCLCGRRYMMDAQHVVPCKASHRMVAP